MSALHQAVTRAIAETRLAAENDWRRVALDKELAAAAIGVCLAEAQRAVEELPRWGGPYGAPTGADPSGEWVRVGPLLAALAALAEEQA